MAYKVLNVDYQQMGKLKQTLEDAAQRTDELLRQIKDDALELAEKWNGPNSEAYLTYFWDHFHVQWYGGSGRVSEAWLSHQAQWVADAIAAYQTLEADIDAEVNRVLANVE